MMRSCREELNCRNHHPIISSFMTYHRFVTRVTRRVPHMGHEQLTLPVNLSSPSAFSGVLVARSLAFSVVFCIYQYLSFFFWPSSIYGFWLPLWYHQTFLCNHTTAEKMNGVILGPDSIYPIILVFHRLFKEPQREIWGTIWWKHGIEQIIVMYLAFQRKRLSKYLEV